MQMQDDNAMQCMLMQKLVQMLVQMLMQNWCAMRMLMLNQYELVCVRVLCMRRCYADAW